MYLGNKTYIFYKLYEKPIYNAMTIFKYIMCIEIHNWLVKT